MAYGKTQRRKGRGKRRGGGFARRTMANVIIDMDGDGESILGDAWRDKRIATILGTIVYGPGEPAAALVRLKSGSYARALPNKQAHVLQQSFITEKLERMRQEQEAGHNLIPASEWEPKESMWEKGTSKISPENNGRKNSGPNI